MSKEEYDKIKPGHYYDAMREGSTIQQFWHNTKFSQMKKHLISKNTRILDIGAGPGCFLSLVEKDFKLAVVSDISFAQLNFAKDKINKINCITCDANKLPFKKESFDYIILSEVIEHLPKESSQNILKSIHKLLKPSGRLILTTPNYKSLWPVLEFFWNFVNPIKYLEQHINKYSIKSLKQDILKAGFSDIKYSTSFFVSSFIALFSKSLAEKVHVIEQKYVPNLGSIIIAEITK